MSTAYANELEQAFGSLPGWLQAPLRPVFNAMNEGLEWVAGDPDTLVAAGGLYLQLGQRIQALADQQTTDRTQLTGHWDGEAYQAFQDKMAGVEAILGKLAEATTRTDQVLRAAAQTAVDAANMIIDLIVTALAILLAEAALNLALSVITFGASLAAEAAEATATMLSYLARIMRVVEKVAQVLEKIASVLRKLSTAFRTVERELKALRLLLDLLKSAKTFYRGAGQWGTYAQWAAKHAAAKTVAGKGLSLATGGVVTIPGAAGSAWDAGKDGYQAWQDSDKAVAAADDS